MEMKEKTLKYWMITEIGDSLLHVLNQNNAFAEMLQRLVMSLYHCDNLVDVVIPETVTEIEPSAFEKSVLFENWKANGSGNLLLVMVFYWHIAEATVLLHRITKQIGLVLLQTISVLKVVLSDSETL